jgi:hypothetical protein
MDKENEDTSSMEYYLTIKKKETTSFVGKWTELLTIMLSEISQT